MPSFTSKAGKTTPPCVAILYYLLRRVQRFGSRFIILFKPLCYEHKRSFFEC